MRLIMLAGLAAGAVAIFAPEQGSSLMRSLEHGVAWGIGREIVHNLLGYHHELVSPTAQPVKTALHRRQTAYGKTRTKARRVLTIASACPACFRRSANGRSPIEPVWKLDEILSSTNFSRFFQF